MKFKIEILLLVVGISATVLFSGCKKNAGCQFDTKVMTVGKCSISNGKEQDESYRYWPLQKVPKGIIRTSERSKFEAVTSPNGKTNAGDYGSTHMMVESVVGLTAKAVNEGRLDEMVWVTTDSNDYMAWYGRITSRLHLEDRGVLEPWQLVERYRDKGIIKGYILYTRDYTQMKPDSNSADFNCSVNVATSLAGLMNAIIIEEGQKEKAEKYGLKMIMDVRDKDMKWCLENYGAKLNNIIGLTTSPQQAYNRDTIVANDACVTFGTGEMTELFMKWLKAPSPILGWNIGGENEHTAINSKYGHFQTATDGAVNMTVLSAGSQDYTPKRAQGLDPTTIDFNSGRNFAVFLMSDGDNTGWFINGYSSFCHSKDYWLNDHKGEFAMGWTTSLANLSQIAPDIVDYLAESKPANASFVEQGGGYYYPDIFAKNRPNRQELLARHAREINYYLKRCGVHILSFIVLNIDSADAMEAYKVYAREMDGLIGMIGLQYYPYDGGDGAVYWFKNKEGVEIPVVCVKYSIWDHAYWPRGGTPAKIARLINEHAQKATQQDKSSYSITSVCAWSYFKKSEVNDENAEDIGKDTKEYNELVHEGNGQRGLTPVKWCIDRLSSEVKVVSPEELIWRIRMEHNPSQTKEIIKNLSHS